MAIVYKGWMPTVAGKLSFSLIGETTENGPAVSVNRADAAHRYIVSYQNRNLNDSVLPRWLSRVLVKYRGSFNFVCVGRSSNAIDDPGELSGSLMVFRVRGGWLKAEREIRYSQQMLAGIDISQFGLFPRFDCCFGSAIDKIKREAPFWVDFKLHRDGVVEIYLHDDIEKSSGGVNYPPSPVQVERIKDTIAAQCFYFLRDLTHRHQHHSPKTDTLMDLYRCDNEIDWRSESLRVLYRKILDFKRIRKDEVYCSSLGLLIYAKSFRYISKDLLGKTIFPSINDKLLEESIKASQVSTNNSLQQSIKNYDRTRNVTIGVLGLYLSLTSLVKLTDKKIPIADDSMLLWLAEITVRNPFISIAFAVCGIYSYLTAKDVVSYGRFKIVRSLLRFLQPLPKVWNVFFWFFAATAGGVVIAHLIK